MVLGLIIVNWCVAGRVQGGREHSSPPPGSLLVGYEDETVMPRVSENGNIVQATRNAIARQVAQGHPPIQKVAASLQMNVRIVKAPGAHDFAAVAA